MSDVTQNLISMMEERIEALKAKGDWDGATTAAKSIVDSTRDNFNLDASAIHDYAQALEILGDLLREHNDIQLALESYSEIIDLLQDEKGSSHISGRVGAKLAIIYEDQEMFDEAKSYYKWSLSRLEAASTHTPLEIAGVCNNLAFIYERENRHSEAEGLLLKALKINREEVGPKDESTADIWNNLGGLQYKSKKYSQALEMHKMALEVRQEILGENHIDTAQSWGNMALVYSAQNDLASAKECFGNALNILEHSSKSKLGDYATINANFVHILRKQGQTKQADSIEKRVAKFVKKHS